MKKTTKALALLLTFLMLFSALSTLGFAADNPISADDLEPFTDVKDSMWFYNYVIWAYDNNYVSGIGNKQFAPTANITRADFVTILGRFDGVDTSKYPGRVFTDVDPGKYYSAYVKWAADNKIVSGVGDGIFAPLANITREQIASIFIRYTEYLRKILPEGTAKTFKDESQISSWAKDAVKAAQTSGIISGTDTGYFLPKSNASRAEVCTMLKNLVEVLKRSTDKTDKVLATYYSGATMPQFYMTEDDIKALDFVYYNGLIVDANVKTYMTNIALRASELDEKRAINPDIKILLAVASLGGNPYFLAATIENHNRAQLVEQIMDAVTKYGFDGIDIDWEFPATEYDKAACADLMTDLRAALDAQGKKDGKTYYLTAAVPATYWPFRIFDMDVLAEVCDYVNIMNYDMNLSNPYTLHHCAPYEDETGLSYSKDSSTLETVKSFLGNGFPSEKIIAGCALYAIGRSDVPANDKNGYGVYTGSGYDSTLSCHYNQITSFIESRGFVRYWNDTAKCPYLYNADSGVFLQYDDDESIKVKVDIAEKYNLGGLFFFEYNEYYSRSYSLAKSTEQWLDGNTAYPPAIDWSKY